VLQAFLAGGRGVVREFTPSPTPPQVDGWPHIVAGEHTLICAPTGSGKTLTAFLAAIDRLVTTPTRRHTAPQVSTSRRCALALTSRRTLRAPLIGIGLRPSGSACRSPPDVAMRTGDTHSNERQKLIRRPPDSDHHARVST
jgi:ATP-dependent Lhr-like helicase